MNLNQVTIPSKNLEKSVAFYTALGLRLIVESMPRYVRFECPDGEATFSIHHVDKSPKGNGITIYFEEEHLDEWVKKLQEKGFKFDVLPTDQPWLWREALLQDPDGNHIILYYAGKNRKNPPWRID
ncbi:VOC family protein [Tamlana crocina]|uniref:VOC family protein n=1 Tax=Tamlana crocina TaxID=393006 RepID=A0ABX1D7N6_9FLAO|nr:VOC family protein [Tamlana crocina]NJX14349.1 VOC family protein [Tamlana crocina]